LVEFYFKVNEINQNEILYADIGFQIRNILNKLCKLQYRVDGKLLSESSETTNILNLQ